MQDELKARKATREAAELAMVRPRVAVRFAEHELEKVIRGVVFAAQALDGVAAGGRVKSALAPNGINPIVRPRGTGQKTAADAFLRRLVTQPEAAPLVADQRPRLEAAIATFDGALNSRLLAATELAEARAQEDGAQEAWISAYAGNVGAIQSVFKKRRSERELYFDRFRASSSVETEDDGGEDGEDEGGPTGEGWGLYRAAPPHASQRGRAATGARGPARPRRHEATRLRASERALPRVARPSRDPPGCVAPSARGLRGPGSARATEHPRLRNREPPSLEGYAP